MNKVKLRSVPIIGNKYHFFDDGKITPSRHSIAVVTRIITPDEAKNIIFDLVDYDHTTTPPTKTPYKISLYDLYVNEYTEHKNFPGFTCYPHDDEGYWCYSPNTDYFVECSIPKYDENHIWFVRHVDGTWFSLDIQSFWQAGLLDVDNEYSEGFDLTDE